MPSAEALGCSPLVKRYTQRALLILLLDVLESLSHGIDASKQEVVASRLSKVKGLEDFVKVHGQVLALVLTWSSPVLTGAQAKCVCLAGS